MAKAGSGQDVFSIVRGALRLSLGVLAGRHNESLVQAGSRGWCLGRTVQVKVGRVPQPPSSCSVPDGARAVAARARGVAVGTQGRVAIGTLAGRFPTLLAALQEI